MKTKRFFPGVAAIAVVAAAAGCSSAPDETPSPPAQISTPEIVCVLEEYECGCGTTFKPKPTDNVQPTCDHRHFWKTGQGSTPYCCEGGSSCHCGVWGCALESDQTCTCHGDQLGIGVQPPIVPACTPTGRCCAKARFDELAPFAPGVQPYANCDCNYADSCPAGSVEVDACESATPMCPPGEHLVDVCFADQGDAGVSGANGGAP